MKIESGKNNQAYKKETKNVYRSEKSVFDSPTNPLKSAETAPSAGAFAKILEEARNRNEKDNQTSAKTGSTEADSDALKSEHDEKISRVADEKKEAEERGSRSDDAMSQNGDENQSQTFAPAVLQSQTATITDASAPAARSILHVADLERIVSSIRTETFENQKQVTIALKNSVLQGLQIRLTLAENGKIKAEFLAAGEQIKKQLKQRKNELSKILSNRSALFSEIEISSQDSGEKE